MSRTSLLRLIAIKCHPRNRQETTSIQFWVPSRTKKVFCIHWHNQSKRTKIWWMQVGSTAANTARHIQYASLKKLTCGLTALGFKEAADALVDVIGE